MKSQTLTLNKILFFSDVEIAADYIFWNVEHMCRKYAKLAAYSIFFHPSAVMPIFLYSIYCIVVGTFDATKFRLPFYIVLPFGTQTIWGFHILCLVEYNIGISYVYCMLSIASYFVCSCFYVDALCEYFEYLIGSVENTVKQSELVKKNAWKTLKLHQKAIDQMKKAIELHVNILEYVFLRVYSEYYS